MIFQTKNINRKFIERDFGANAFNHGKLKNNPKMWDANGKLTHSQPFNALNSHEYVEKILTLIYESSVATIFSFQSKIASNFC